MAVDYEETIRKVIVKHVNLEDTFIFLFGSRAEGRAKAASDYDVGLYRGQEIPLALLARIKDELESHPIPVEVELVDFATTSVDFRRLALKRIRLWNTPKKDLKLT